MEQHLLSAGPLLNEERSLCEAGYAFSLVKKYDRKAIKGMKSRIKEWDYYYIGNDRYGIALTIDDNSYMDLCSCTILDFENGSYLEQSRMGAFSFGKRNLPPSSVEGVTHYADKAVDLTFEHKDGKRHLFGTWKAFHEKQDLHIDLWLEETTAGKSMVIATPFLKKRHFYYNQKINNLAAKGKATLGEREWDFDGSIGVLDWGRGVWTYSNTWYWSSLSCFQDGHKIGWNLGYGFGDTRAASENMLFVDEEAYKLNDVRFEIPKEGKKDDFLSPWRIVSESGDIDLVFEPILNRHGGANVLLIKSDQNQVFGRFSGQFRLPDGKLIEIKNQTGFAEKVSNRW